MEFEKPKVYKVAEQVFDDYRSRLATALLEHGWTAEAISTNTDMKAFVANYVQTEIIDAKIKNDLIGITHRLAHMEIQSNQLMVFPVVHQYSWHNLQGTIIFYMQDGRPTTELIPVEKSAIIV